MADKPHLRHPWLVATWPGMGNVGLNAGVYLLSKLDMNLITELEAGDLFDVDAVEVREGMLQPVRRPRNRFFYWTDPRNVHDLVLFIGEAQPPLGRYSFCRQLIRYVMELGVERVFTFAAMATQMHPEQRSTVYGAAIDRASLEELRQLELKPLESGQIGGLNGVLLGAAAEVGLRGACLLGEMPHIFRQLPFPKASLAILEVFTTIAGIELDFGELAEQSRQMEQQLGAILTQVEQTYGQQIQAGPEAEIATEPEEEERLPELERIRIDELFRQASQDRSKAFELKQLLDRLGIFKEYEDRFLDLFKKAS